jgi:diguanylate cyclase (GGDEF)-like protein
MWLFTIRSPSNAPLVYVLKAGKNTLGRDPNNDITIGDESVSRWHAEIDCQADRVVIQDLGSKNGTFVNVQRISGPQVLKSGDQIHIGQQAASILLQDNSTPPTSPNSISETQPNTRELTVETVDKRATLLYEVAYRLTTVLDLEEALQEISSLMGAAMGAEKCGVIQAEHFDQLRELGFSTSVARQAITQRSAVVFPDLSDKTKKTLSKSAQMLRIRTALCVPVILGDEVAGLVYVYRTDPAARLFDQNDVQLAVAISHQAALSIQRARLLEQTQVLEKWAIIDSLTGLNNRRQTLNLAELEFQRAQRVQHSMALLMLDIDHFKEVNDTFGHAVGDQVLKVVAARFRQQLRSIDLLGRHGGDEFVILLIETGLDAAQGIAERLRRCVADEPIDTDRGPINVTISVGVAALTNDDVNLSAQLDRADGAMYAAKEAGRNQVKVSVQ